MLFVGLGAGATPAVDVSAARAAVVDGAKVVTENMSGTVTDILPYAVGLIAIVLVVTFGIKTIKRFTSKA